MNEFNLNPIPHNTIRKVTNDRNPKRENKQEQENKKEKKPSEPDAFESQDKQVELDAKVAGLETEVSKDTFSVGEEPPKPGYTVDWVRMNNLKHSRNEP